VITHIKPWGYLQYWKGAEPLIPYSFTCELSYMIRYTYYMQYNMRVICIMSFGGGILKLYKNLYILIINKKHATDFSFFFFSYYIIIVVIERCSNSIKRAIGLAWFSERIRRFIYVGNWRSICSSPRPSTKIKSSRALRLPTHGGGDDGFFKLF